MKTQSLILIGFGAVHQALARLLLDKQTTLLRRYQLEFQVVGVADSQGAIYHEEGLDLATLLEHKAQGESVVTFPGGRPLPDALTLARTARYDLLLEASPVHLTDGEPALSCVRAALLRNRGAVLANKAPLVLDFAGLDALSRDMQAGLAYSATVCGGLPVINVGRRDLVAADIHRIQGIFNSTSNYILTRMAAGEGYAEALAEAQRRGLAETDPSLDVDGWDTANKLVIVANAILGLRVGLEDVQVTGMRDITPDDLRAARATGHMIRLIATAQRSDAGWHLDVAPRQVPLDSFLGQVDGWEMGIQFHTDIFEDVYLKIDERGPMATAAAMLRDAVHLAQGTPL